MEGLLVMIDDMIKVNSGGASDKDVCPQELARPEEFTPPPGKVYDHKTATTPTDVHDINF